MTKEQKIIIIRIIVSACLLVIWHFIPASGWVQFVFYLVPYLIVGYDILAEAFLGIIHGQVFDENFLMAVATVGAFFLGEYTEGSAVMIFYQIGELFEDYAVDKSRKNIATLMDIRPDYANVETTDGVVRTDPDEVPVGTVICVEPGEKVPIDGEIIEGTSTLDTSALTGESLPMDAAIGDAISSGCVNLTGVLRIRTTKVFGESTVSKILDLVENSSMKKSRSENFISRFAKIYTPSVCLAALLLAILPPLVRYFFLGLSFAWGNWVFRALTFLVISCPCALVISIPLSFFGGIGGASRRGILVKGSIYLEELSKASCLVFDKTGTLTKGTFTVQEVLPANGMDADEVLLLAACAERHSPHPISQSLRDACKADISLSDVKDVRELAGRGVFARVNEKEVYAGNARLMEEQGISYEPCAEPGTVVYVAADGKYLGSILIADTVKPGAAKALSSLRAEGIKKTVMLTGDNAETAQAVADLLGIDEVHSGLLPADKVSLVEDLLENRTGKEKIAFVGDGINDAPVLARADIGIAMGAMGSDAAIEAADVVLMDDDPGKIALAIRISRKCLRIVYENIVFALVVKGLCLILSALGWANMWLAIFADVGVMVIAVLNAMRALRIPQK